MLTGRTVDPYNPKVVRATTGSLFHLPVSVGGDLADVVKRAHAAGLRILAADVKGDDLLEARADGVLAEPTGWLFGNEARGLEDDALAPGRPGAAAADLRQGRIPQSGDRCERLPVRERLRTAGDLCRLTSGRRRKRVTGSMRILIVEDDDRVAAALEAFLARSGYATVRASDVGLGAGSPRR